MSDRAAIYLRVSTEEQDTCNQLPTIEKYCAEHSLRIVRSYEENDTAWKAGHQVEFKRLLSDALRGKFDYLIVWALDRITREGSAKLTVLINTLGQRGVKVISIQEPFTQAVMGPMGEVIAELLYAVYGCMARLESQRRSERVKAGMARARKEGKHLGRPVGVKEKKKRRRRVRPAPLVSA
ncbi:recombinase family protein [Chloroflexota bacterium]